jgi:uncharacterized membrane protein
MLIANNKLLKCLFLFMTGGFAYGAVENLARGYSHISMFIAGGICFVLIGLLNETTRGNLSIISRMAISAVIITMVEFIAGVIVNIWLKLNVWNYADMPFNIMGQVCLLYTVIWFFISFIAILMDDYIRYFILKEDKPRYRLL